jgi:glycosyltransferase involved in cell wall biosynthesis
MTSDVMRPVRVLFFEPEHLGHQPSYVRAVAEWLDRERPPLEAVFSVSADLVARLRDEDGVELARIARLRLLEPGDLAACNDGPIYRRGMARWRLILREMSAAGASHAHALFLDPLQLPLALGHDAGDDRGISGILFRPSVHDVYRESSGRGLRERVRDQLKRVSYAGMLRNPSLKAVLSLDPLFPAYAHRRFAEGGKVRSVPDPIIEAESGGAPSAPAPAAKPVAGQREPRCCFLLFGALSERKGVKVVLQALESMSDEQRGQVRVLLAGRLDEDCRAAVAGARARLAEAGRETEELEVLDRFLSTDELAALVRQCDVVMAPYQRHVGSSGALVWAARHGRPVLAQQYGLVGAMVRRHGLGVSVDSSDVHSVADAMVRLSCPRERAGACRAEGQVEFLAGRSADEFARRVCETVLEVAA